MHALKVHFVSEIRVVVDVSRPNHNSTRIAKFGRTTTCSRCNGNAGVACWNLGFRTHISGTSDTSMEVVLTESVALADSPLQEAESDLDDTTVPVPVAIFWSEEPVLMIDPPLYIA
jgi:hypothetical protein